MLLVHDLTACSMYKITTDGKTMVGCNYDAWFTTPKIWFENARTPDEYGADSPEPERSPITELLLNQE